MPRRARRVADDGLYHVLNRGNCRMDIFHKPGDFAAFVKLLEEARQLTGMRIFNQSCRVCHTKPLLTAGQYGPVLSRDTLGGDAAALRDFISNGTPRMPGFKLTYTPAQIDAIAAYLKTVPPPPASPQ